MLSTVSGACSLSKITKSKPAYASESPMAVFGMDSHAPRQNSPARIFAFNPAPFILFPPPNLRTIEPRSHEAHEGRRRRVLYRLSSCPSWFVSLRGSKCGLDEVDDA